MCIRDSLRVDRSGALGGRALALLGRADEDRDLAEVLVLVCLLYTSDAADDLLCVDLGGRRTIKKKR